MPRQVQLPELKQATLIPEARPLPLFNLVDHKGAEFTPARLRKHWSFLFFGYTHCPDICPVTMTVFQQTALRLRDTSLGGGVVQFVLVSIDPERDTPEQLAQFVAYFHQDFIGVTGTPPAIDNITRELGIMHAKTGAGSTDSYTVEHSASILLVDPQARLYAIFSPPHQPDDLAADLKQLARYYESTL